MRERVINTFIVVALLIGIFIGAVKVYTDISVNKALITFNEAMSNRDYDTANKLYLNYLGRSRFKKASAEIISKSGKDAVGLMTNEYAGQETCKEASDTLNSIQKMGYVPTPAERELVRNSFNTLFTEYYYENTEDKQETAELLKTYTTLNDEVFFYEDKDFFEKCFNDIMSDIISEKITADDAAVAYALLSPVYPESRNFVVERLNKLYTSYNEEQIKYQCVVDICTAIKNSGMAVAVAETNLAEAEKLNKSKTAFYDGVEAMNSADYLSAYRNFDEVKEFDLNFEQKNTYYNDMLPKAKAAAFSLIEKDCAEHKFDEARQAVTDYDKYLDSDELRGKTADIDRAEKHYQRMLEAVNAIKVHNVSVTDDDIRISWTNMSDSDVESVDFTLDADGETVNVLYAGGFEAGEYVSREPDFVTSYGDIYSVRLQSVVISYTNGDLIIDEDYVPYILD